MSDLRNGWEIWEGNDGRVVGPVGDTCGCYLGVHGLVGCCGVMGLHHGGLGVIYMVRPVVEGAVVVWAVVVGLG